MTTGKTIVLPRQTFVGEVMSLLLNMPSRLVITFLPRSKHLLISWLQSPSAVILEVGCSPWGLEELDTTEGLPFHFSLSFIGEGNGNPLQCSCLENPRDGGAWWAAVYGVTQSRTRLKQLTSSSSKIKSDAVSTVSPSISHEVMGFLLSLLIFLFAKSWISIIILCHCKKGGRNIISRGNSISQANIKNVAIRKNIR